MRIIAGSKKGMTLYSVEGRDTRPTTDRIKETLFNIIAAEVPNAVFLDLFSGTGQIGLEALSRGADSCVFVEKSKKAAGCIRDNIDKTKFGEQCELLERDVMSALGTLFGRRFDIIFIDPPYKSGLEETVLRGLAENHLLSEGTLVIMEAEKETDFSFANELGYEITREKVYKTNKHVFFEPKNGLF